MNTGFLGIAVATVLTVYGIETSNSLQLHPQILEVATVLTVYGIETFNDSNDIASLFYRLQQYLPFTVLKQRTI